MKNKITPKVRQNEDGMITEQGGTMHYLFNEDDPRYVDIAIVDYVPLASVDLEKGTIIMDGGKELTAEQLFKLANQIKQLKKDYDGPPF